MVRETLPLGVIWQCLGIFLVVTSGEVLLTPSEERPGMLQDALQCTGRPPTAKTHPAQSVALLLRNPVLVVRQVNLVGLVFNFVGACAPINIA